MSKAPETSERWRERRQVLGAAQATYLWVLLVSCAFFAAIQPTSSDAPFQVKAPIVELELDGRVVAACGPIVISFLLLVMMGALRASSHACKEAGIADFTGEALDLHPNALDLAFYTSKASPRVMIVVTYFKYPAFLTLALVEAAWLWVRLPQALLHVTRAVALVLWVGAAWQIGAMWLGRLRKVPQLLRQRR